MFFSICMAVYNASQYLQDSVNSIISQDYSDYELILVDDASTDGSGELCDEIAAKHPDFVRVIHHEKNEGLLIARRTFFYNAKGKWFIAVDADDLLVEGALEKLHSVIEMNECDLVLYDLECIHMNGRVERFTVPLQDNHIFRGQEKKLVYEQISKNNYINSICTKAIYHTLIDYETDYTPWKSLRFGTDIFQSYAIFDNAKAILYLRESLYSYIKRKEAITTKWHKNWYIIRRMLWLRDKEFRTKWNMGVEYEIQASESYIKGTVFYLDSQFIISPRYNQMKVWYQSIYDDGDIKECLEVVRNTKKRHRLYAMFLANHRFTTLYYLQWLFYIAKKVLIER